MNIDEMRAGREMDVLFAERVIGWTRKTFDEYDYLHPVPEFTIGWSENWQRIGNVSVPRAQGEKDSSELQHFSTDIVVVWPEFARFPLRSLKFNYKECEAGVYSEPHNKWIYATAKPDESALAICRVMFKALDLTASK